jgi:hypothetical protein
MLVAIDGIIQSLEKLVAEYHLEKSHFDTMTWDESIKNIIHYQLKTLDLGYRHHISTLNWFKTLRLQANPAMLLLHPAFADHTIFTKQMDVFSKRLLLDCC